MDLSRTAIMMTAWRRPQYLRQVLASWAKVDGVRDVAAFVVCLDASGRQDQMINVIQTARRDHGLPIVVHLNQDQDGRPAQFGVSINPVEGGTLVFREFPTVDYLVMAEEDLIVADDTLRYLSWADETFRDNPEVLIACAHSPDNPDPEADPAAVVLQRRFRCWIWATWRDRWFGTLEPTWDRAYYTGNVETGQQAGFDWNIDLRVIHGHDPHTKGRKYLCALPLASRSQNKGKFEGVHADPTAYEGTLNPSFRETFGEVDYRLSGTEAAEPRIAGSAAHQ